MNPDNPNFRTPEEETRAAELVRLKAEVARQAKVIEKLREQRNRAADQHDYQSLAKYRERIAQFEAEVAAIEDGKTRGIRKVVINACYGGFGISHEGMLRYFALKGIEVWPECVDVFCNQKFYRYWTKAPEERPTKPGLEVFKWSIDDHVAYKNACNKVTLSSEEIMRDDPALVRIVEELGIAVNSRYSNLRVVEIPDDVLWQIDDYEGYEHVAEVHRRWTEA